jgi:WhiB family redox-sensing transcriptional regulator
MTKPISYEALDWFVDARCAGKSATFFGVMGEATQVRRQRERLAIEICNTCPAILKCRQFAREYGELGVWGGETEDQRFDAGFLRDPNVVRRNKAKERRQSLKQLKRAVDYSVGSSE